MGIHDEIAARPADSLFFYAEHVAILMAGFYCVSTYLLERFQPAFIFAAHYGGQVAEGGAAVSASYLLLSVPLIVVSLLRMLLFYGRSKMAQFKAAPQRNDEPGVRIRTSLYVQKRHLQNEGRR